MSQYERRHRRATQRRRSEGRVGVRYVTSEARDVFDPEAMEMMREMCRGFDTAVEPLDAERIASRCHGRMWELRRRATTPRQPDWSFGLGAPFARELARIGGIGAKGLLLTLGYQAPRRLGQLCAELASDLDVPTPVWADEVPYAQLTRAAGCVPDGVECLMLEFRRGPHQPFTISVMISAGAVGIAKHYGLLGPFESFAEGGDPDGEFVVIGRSFWPVDRTDACRRIQSAIDQADQADPGLFDLASAKEHRALTLGRIKPYVVPPPL
jgi:hypothetical protein